MIAYIKGKIAEVRQDSLVIENSGFGIEVFVPQNVLNSYSLQKEVMLYTYFKISEDAFSLYGFDKKRDLDLFKKIITVSGIGVKGAINLLSYFSTDELIKAILAEDIKTISKVHGIGVKIAKRMVLDIKDKISNEDITLSNLTSDDNESNYSDSRKEAIEALVALGYSLSEARSAVSKVEAAEDMDSESILKLALKFLVFWGNYGKKNNKHWTYFRR